MNTEVYLNKISTAIPGNEIHSALVSMLKRAAISPGEAEKIETINQKCQIENRYSVLKPSDLDISNPEAFYCANHFPSTGERMIRYQHEAFPLVNEALQNLLTAKNKTKITHFILTSCTGFYAPGLDIDVIQKFELNPSIERNLIGFMGCYAAIPALKLAYHIVRSQPQAQVLLLNIELCSLHWRRNAPLDQLVTFLLFADGCAASLVSAIPQGLRINSFYNTVMPDTQPYMKWIIGDDGFYMNLDPGIPKYLAKALHQGKTQMLNNKKVTDMSLWAVHPGGRSVLDAVQNIFELDENAMAASRKVLRYYGNMSSATVMFVLKQLLDDPHLHGEGVAMAFGPGLSLESFLFTKVLQ